MCDGYSGYNKVSAAKRLRLPGTYPQISDRCDPERKTTGLYTAPVQGVMYISQLSVHEIEVEIVHAAGRRLTFK